MMYRLCAVAGALAVLLAVAIIAAPVPARAANPPGLVYQTHNLLLGTTRSKELTPKLLGEALVAGARRGLDRLKIHLRDPGRAPDPNLCTLPICVGDPRLDHWADGKGIVRPVLFTARDGATLSGHIWATRNGTKRRPGVVIVNGSIVGFEQAYWWAAQALAKDGYVVMTFDAQGEGDSDQLGAPPDRAEDKIAGSPPFGDGGGFYDGVEDALDFFLSTPDQPYVPRPSRTSHTSHAAKQHRRVAAGRQPAYDPLYKLLDARHIGLAGHSYGAVATSYIAQVDRRVDAEVAWDRLCIPRDSTRSENAAIASPEPGGPKLLGVIPLPIGLTSLSARCFGAPKGYAPDVRPRVPSLGLSADYLLPAPLVAPVDPDYKARASEAFSRAGVDSANIVIRGGDHLEWSFTPTPVGTLRGIDLSTWYTAAWFDRYLKRDPTAIRRLRTDRWRHDARTREVDPGHDPDALSQIYRSRLDIHTRRGREIDCEDLRAGCELLVPKRRDCGPRSFGYVKVDTAADDGDDPLVDRRRCGRRSR